MKVLVIAGNGLSMAMLAKRAVPGIDLSNLFAMGSDVSWPANDMPGFLSFEHCPNLWALGGRQTANGSSAYQVIEQIITAVNACCLADPTSLDDGIYIKAYKELVSYLRHLFVHYDALLQEAKFFDSAEVFEPIDWLIEACGARHVSDIDIVTFNYDAFLERALQKKGIGFEVPLLAPSSGTKVRIHKPHGSITFCGKTAIDRSAFQISYDSRFTEGGIDDLAVKYDGLGEHYPLVGILPPAGESERYSHRWIRQIWDKAIEAGKNIGADDIVVLFGLSYWHVDRKEIDMLLAKLARKARVISVNPNPNPQLEAVCCSLFKNYHSYSNPKQLIRMFK